MKLSKKIIGLFLVTLIFAFLGCGFAESGFSNNDFIRQIVYDSAVQTAEEAGYENYEIVIDDDNNVEIIVYDKSKTTKPPVEKKKQESVPAISGQESDEENVVFGSEKEYALGMQLLEEENIIDAMPHFLKALPNDDAEKIIAENAYDYVDELMFSENYQTAQAFMIEHPFDGYEQMLAECNDYCFPIDLAKALETRWSMSSEDISTWPDKKVREKYQQMVECETKYLEKYKALGFSDNQMANYAYAYIGALQSQLTGAAYYGVDSEKFNQNWYDHGYNVRARLIYLINRKYGIEIRTSFSRSFKEIINEGKNQDFVYAVTQMFTEQLSNADVSFRSMDLTVGGTKKYLQFVPFRLINTSGYSLTQYLVYAVFLDDKGKEIETKTVFASEKAETRDGEDLPSAKDSMYTPFSSYYFRCEFSNTSYYWYTCDVYPSVNCSWDGKEVISDGYRTDDLKSSVKLEEFLSYWTTHSDTFVPCTEFILRNDGHTDINEASIECVFINKDDNTEWSRDKYYALSSSDVPLHSGQGRNVIVYSGKGFEKKTRKVPNLTVEIYVNGEAIDKIDVKKP